VNRIRGARALTWCGDYLYVAQGYQVLRAHVQDPSRLAWSPVARFRPTLRRRITVVNRLTSRLFRDGFHALAVLSTGGIVGAVAGAIVSLLPGESEFSVTHPIHRGTRPLHVTAVPGGRVYWGEYLDNAARSEVHIYASADDGLTWDVAYTFPKGAIRHVHNIVHDPWEDCLWVLTGDYGDECRILRAARDFSQLDTVLQGNQQVRAVALVPMPEGLYFASDTPLESNYIYCLERQGRLSRLAPISSSSICGCRVGERVFFSTMVEPSQVNRERVVRIYQGEGRSHDWRPMLEWRKDRWPMGLFQYGNAFLPDGNNSTPFLAVSTVAVESDDMTTSLYRLES